jgi:hypothetical protein
MNKFYIAFLAGVTLAAGCISSAYCADPAVVRKIHERTTEVGRPGQVSNLFYRAVTSDGKVAEIEFSARKDSYQRTPLAVTVRMDDKKMTLIDENLDGRVDHVLYMETTFSDRQSLRDGQIAYDRVIGLYTMPLEKRVAPPKR